MKKPAIKKAIKRQFRELNESYKAIQDSWSMEAIHAFRVDVKQLRAFIRMVNTGSKEKLSLPRRLKKVYRRTGQLRNWQLFMQTFSRNRNLKRYAARSLDTAMENLRQAMQKNLLVKAKAKLLKKIPGECRKNDMQVFRHNKMRVIDDLSGLQQFKDDDFHTIRKNLKDLQYDNLLTKDSHRKKYYKVLTEKLGALQDCRMELQLLEEINRHQASTKIQKLLNNNLQKKNRLLHEIKSELNRYRG